ncbi:eebba2af-4534-4773-b12c-169dcb6c2276 [Thermothielavioides terrestris]|uniref:Eebba2af-4534-4773-b12c-169dcb6c2276 n=1 Tax=Thermothielavioides terrestris TaxID=2587410 RepID=A0A3S4AZ26_9PEZI|nr:eebba2af-4534-4773-b12c-169dcb6c2276 [Thermothielavioides terrestris]
MRNLTPGFPSSAETEEALRFFRSQMLPCFPFLTLPPSLTGSQLRNDRPILFQAILTVTTFSAQRRLPRIEELKQLVFNSALMSSQSSMDLLLGLLTYIAWSTDAFLGRADLLSRLMVLAISLVYDLRLFKPSRPDVQAIVAYTQGFPDDDPGAGDLMERQRAVLACFVLSSQISCHFGRIDALRWTPQMEDALRVVAANKSCPTDETFAAQVRLQLLTHRAVQVREQHDADSDRFRGGGTPTSSSISGLLYLNTLRTELQALRASLNLDTDHPQPWPADLLATHAHYTAVYLDQTALSLSPPPQPGTHGGPTSSSAGSSTAAGGYAPGLERLTAFHRSAESIAGWLAAFQRMPASRCLALPSHFWTQAVWCNAVLKHLSTHPDPALDCRAVRSRVDLLTALDWMVAKLEAVSAEAAGATAGGGGGTGLVPSDDLFRLLARLFGRARVWAEARWDLSTALPQGQASLAGQQAGHGADHCAAGTGQGVVDGRVPDVEDMSWMDSMDLENDKWLEDVLGWSPATT